VRGPPRFRRDFRPFPSSDFRWSPDDLVGVHFVASHGDNVDGAAATMNLLGA